MMRKTTKRSGLLGAVLTVLGVLTILSLGLIAASKLYSAGIFMLSLWALLWSGAAIATGVTLIRCLVKRRREILGGEEEEAKKY